MKRDLTTRDLERANIPRRYWDAKLAAIPESAPYRADVAHYIGNLVPLVELGIGLYLWSEQNGTGKTAIACIILKEAMKNRLSAYYIRSQALKDAVLSDLMFDEANTVRDRVRAVEVLVIDDFAKEYKGATGYAETLIEDVIRDRVQQKRVTILTSNLAPDKIKVFFSEDLSDVLREAAATLRIVGGDEGGKTWREEGKAEVKRMMRR